MIWTEAVPPLFEVDPTTRNFRLERKQMAEGLRTGYVTLKM